MGRNKILLHICCGICASSAVQKLKQDDFEVTGFFYNPNIHPQEEYKRRLEVVRKVSEILEFPLIEGTYKQNDWVKLVKGLENEPERGKRCEVCFEMRLKETYNKSRELNIPIFTTTLSLSPHKTAFVINSIGNKLSEEGFLKEDFKKKNGAKLAMEFAKEYNLYRQHYCGCVYSKKDSL